MPLKELKVDNGKESALFDLKPIDHEISRCVVQWLAKPLE